MAPKDVMDMIRANRGTYANADKLVERESISNGVIQVIPELRTPFATIATMSLAPVGATLVAPSTERLTQSRLVSSGGETLVRRSLRRWVLDPAHRVGPLDPTDYRRVDLDLPE